MSEDDVVDDEVPIIEEGMETMDLAEEVEIEIEDPLDVALARAETAEKEIAYKDAEIQNVRKRLMAEKAELIQYSGMGLARRMLTVLSDVDRALANVGEDDEGVLAQGLRLTRNKMWHELQADGVLRLKPRGRNLIQQRWRQSPRFQHQRRLRQATWWMFSKQATCTNKGFSPPHGLL